jgi:hypothetical protein
VPVPGFLTHEKWVPVPGFLTHEKWVPVPGFLAILSGMTTRGETMVEVKIRYCEV